VSSTFPELKYFGEFTQAPGGGSIVLGENNQRNIGVFDGFKNRGRDFIPFVKPVIYEGLDVLLLKSCIEMACEAVARVLTSKTDENIVSFKRYSRRERGRRRR